MKIQITKVTIYLVRNVIPTRKHKSLRVLKFWVKGRLEFGEVLKFVSMAEQQHDAISCGARAKTQYITLK